MKNQYIADIGDYGKYGLLRFLAGKGIKIGVNWYLTSDDGSSDGKFTGYLENEKERFRDPELFDSLRHIAGCPEKSVEMIQNEGLIPGACYYAEPIPCTGQDMRARRINRSLWFNNSTLYLHDAELIFADPDNGNTMVKKEGSKGIEKYTLPQELKEYYNHDHNVVYYCSKGRRKWEAWEDTKTEMQSVLPDCNIYALTFHKGTQRTYIFLIHPKDFQRYMRILSEFLRSSWKPVTGKEVPAEEHSYPEDLTDRQVYDTSIGPVCMSKREYQDYQDQLAIRQMNQENNDSDNGNGSHGNKGKDNG